MSDSADLTPDASATPPKPTNEKEMLELQILEQELQKLRHENAHFQTPLARGWQLTLAVCPVLITLLGACFGVFLAVKNQWFDGDRARIAIETLGLEKEKSALSKEVDAFLKDKNALVEKVAALESERIDIKGRLRDLQNMERSLQAEITALKEAKELELGKASQATKAISELLQKSEAERERLAPFEEGLAIYKADFKELQQYVWKSYQFVSEMLQNPLPPVTTASSLYETRRQNATILWHELMLNAGRPARFEILQASRQEREKAGEEKILDPSPQTAPP